MREMSEFEKGIKAALECVRGGDLLPFRDYLKKSSDCKHLCDHVTMTGGIEILDEYEDE